MGTIHHPNWGSASFAYPTSFISSEHGGAGTPNADYPDLAACEAVKTSTAAPAPAPNSATIVDVDTSMGEDYGDAGLAFLAFGPESGGYYDSTDETTFEWDQYFGTAALNQSGYCRVAVQVTKFGSDPEEGLFTGDAFIQLCASQDAGANFTWELYWVQGGAGQSLASASDVADDAWHRCKIVWKPGTVTGARSGNYYPRASDGYLHFYVDGTPVYSQTNIAFDIQDSVINAANKGYGWWLGYFSMLGPIGDAHLYQGGGTSLPEPTLVSSTPPECCDPSGATPSPTAGAITPMVNPTWYPECAGLGTVPEAPDLVEPESWIS